MPKEIKDIVEECVIIRMKDVPEHMVEIDLSWLDKEIKQIKDRLIKKLEVKMLDLKSVDKVIERVKIKEAFDRGVEEANYRKKIPAMLEEVRIKETNRWLAKEIGFEWRYE